MITVTILAKNSAKTLGATLDSLKGFPEVLVCDTGSLDDTVKIASSYPNTKVHFLPFEGFGPTHNKASALASYDWILSIDSDETLTENLAQEILSLKLESDVVYAIERSNFFRNKHIRCCSGWYPNWVLRLYNRKTTSFSEDMVHEKLLMKGLKTQKLQNKLLHTPYQGIEDFLTKMQTYSTLFATMNAGKKSSSTAKALLHASFAFVKSYLFKRGFMGGSEGLIISLYSAHVAWYKYLKLAERNRSRL